MNRVAKRSATAAGASLLTLACVVELAPYLPFQPLLLFLAPVIVCAALSGLAAGLVATAVSAPVAVYFLVPPRHSFALDEKGLASLTLFVLLSVFISALAELNLRHSRQLVLGGSHAWPDPPLDAM